VLLRGHLGGQETPQGIVTPVGSLPISLYRVEPTLRRYKALEAYVPEVQASHRLDFTQELYVTAQKVEQLVEVAVFKLLTSLSF
jgi:hypothetical protein